MSDRFIKIASVSGFSEAEQVLGALRENGIDAFRRGGIMDAYAANSMAGEDIMVCEGDYDAAKALQEAFAPVGTGPRVSMLPAYQTAMNRILLGMIAGILALALAALL